MAKDYSHLSKQELLRKIEKLESRKKYGLIWDEERTKEKFEKDAENALPVLKEIKGKEIKSGSDQPMNVLIEGDNYHALSVLNFTHRGKIDVIYIDPPFNTGNKDFYYNDSYVDREDAYRHSKWLSFMKKRLALAKNLLSDEGSIFIQIDSNEGAQLKLLMDEIFGEQYFRNQITWQRSSSGKTTSRNISEDTDYIIWYSKGEDYIFNKVYKPLAETTKRMYSKDDHDGRGLYRLYPLQKTGGPGPATTYDYIDNNGRVWKCPAKGWRMRKEKLKILENEGRLSFGGKTLSEKAYWNERDSEGQIANNLWNDIPNIQGSSREKVDFAGGQKPIALIQRILEMTSRKNSIVVDFFAGSGTTGHSVLEMNKSDGGNRQFILCTNNDGDICTKICYPRIMKAIKDYKNSKGKKMNGLSGNLKYFKTSFVKKSLSKDDLKIRITHECTEMLCLREGIFDEVKSTGDYKIFKQANRIMGVYYSLDRAALKNLKKELEKMIGEKILYCFTLDPLGLDKSDFADWNGVSLEPIPQKILDVYEQIYEY